ncbi:hypothetical protein ABZ383_34570 [Streptomyces sp. NPDC005900]|uniref:hypothetical protein n=1 Tax=Streptomyces sp. NPDC005900 TaxID=3154569 RepID=UPI0033C88111
MTTVTGKLIGAGSQRVEMQATLVDVTGAPAVGYAAAVPGELVRPVAITPSPDGDWAIDLTPNTAVESVAGDTLWAIQEGRAKNGTPILTYILVPATGTHWVGDLRVDLSDTVTGGGTVVYVPGPAGAPGAAGAEGPQGPPGETGPAGPQPPLGAAGDGPTVALRSDDPSTVDARTPLVHAVSHASGSSDPVTPGMIGADPAGAAAAAQAAAINAAADDTADQISAHTAAADPHGDRAYSNGITGPLAGRVLALENGVVYKTLNLADLASASTARSNLGLGGAATLNVGTTAGTVAAGDDSRMSNARTPTAHASTHASGGTDPVTPAAIGALTQTQGDARYLQQTGGVVTGTVTANVLSATTTAVGGGVTADTFDRWRVLANGTLEVGPGSGARDTNLRRSGANEWTTDDALVVSLMLRHLGATLGFYGAAAVSKPAVTGSRGGNAALASLLTALAQLGLITDSTTA